MEKPRILLADDHTMLLDAFKKLLEPVYQVVGAVTDGRALIEQAVKLRPDILLVDISMPRLNGLDACERIKALLPDAKIIFLTQNEDPDTAAEAVRRGASGYVRKGAGASELFAAIQAVLQGRIYITPFLTGGKTSLFVTEAKAKANEGGPTLSLRQREVLQLLAEGKVMKEVADILKVTSRTVAFHKYAMMKQLGAKTNADLVRHALQLGLLAAKASNPTASGDRQSRVG